ncbi:MAG: ATP-binding protein [Cryomorphaceae bacterium]|nr:ATP-binding protein [Cryomorphaceae bacterium]
MNLVKFIKTPIGFSTFVALFATLGLFAVSHFFFSLNVLSQSFILTTIFFFVAIFFVVKILFEWVVYKQIKSVYRSIGKQYKDERRFSLQLDAMQREVDSYNQTRAAEIAELKEREKFRREFIGNVSHELKTPVFNVQGYLLTLLDGALNDPEINEKYVKRANKSVERMISIIKDLDVITKLESGALEPKMTTYDLHGQILETFEELEELAKGQGVVLRFKENYEPPILVKADSKRVGQVLVNLLENAIKYAKLENGFVEVAISSSTQNVEISITDNGLGIPEKDLPRIFERFYRVDKSRTRDAGGSGLGLAIVKHIIEAHKQTIKAKSVEGVGSSFLFTLKKG